MATNEIPIAPTSQLGPQLLAYRQQVINYLQAQTLLKFAGAVMLGKVAAASDTVTPSYTQLESLLSLQAGQGVTVFSQLNSAVGNLANTDSTAAVNASLNQFVNWIG